MQPRVLQPRLPRGTRGIGLPLLPLQGQVPREADACSRELLDLARLLARCEGDGGGDGGVERRRLPSTPATAAHDPPPRRAARRAARVLLRRGDLSAERGLQCAEQRAQQRLQRVGLGLQAVARGVAVRAAGASSSCPCPLTTDDLLYYGYLPAARAPAAQLAVAPE
jgi:hypothetical protein